MTFRSIAILSASLAIAGTSCRTDSLYYPNETRSCAPVEATWAPAADPIAADRIQPYRGNACYWQYKGRPILLLGASDQDNLFNHPDIWPFGLESHLDLMVRFGGNYLRNTMSSRDPGNLWPFARGADGLYDLARWDEDYWRRLERFLELTYDRDIIVQVEIWDRFDYSREPWGNNAFNPKNNRNYTSEESGLPEVIRAHPGRRENPFFRTVPDLEDRQMVLQHQKRLVERILATTLQYPNVLYTISNETNESPLWSAFWAHYLHELAAAEGVQIYVTEMWDARDLTHPTHEATFRNPDLYAFADISQNNHQDGETHWNNMQRALAEALSDPPRPVNSVKVYGGPAHGTSLEEGARRFWRNIIGGLASSRFHRTVHPFRPSGAGLSPLAQMQMHSLRMITDSLHIFSMTPRPDLLSNRERDEAYLIGQEGVQYAIYFPDGGDVVLDLTHAPGRFYARWLDILTARWLDPTPLTGGDGVRLGAPGGGPWAVLILREF
jgi:hypothetical protein